MSSLPPGSFVAMADSEVLVRVGDQVLTKQDVLDNVSMATKLAAHKAGGRLSEKGEQAIARKVKHDIMNRFVRMALIGTVLATNKVEVSDGRYAEFEAKFYAGFNGRGKKASSAKDSLNARERAIVERSVRHQLELDTYLEKTCTLTVTEAEITNALTKARSWNAMIDMTNRYAYAMASNIVKWAAQGQDFGKLADKYSQDPEKKPGGLIDDHAAVSFSDGRTSYLDMLDRMPAGKVSDILPSIEGLMIVKALGKSEKTGMPLYQRIILMTGEKYPEYTREQIISIGKGELREAAVNRLLRAAGDSVKVEYPHGEKVFQ